MPTKLSDFFYFLIENISAIKQIMLNLKTFIRFILPIVLLKNNNYVWQIL